MRDPFKLLRRTWKRGRRRVRELRMIARGVLSTDHPVLAHVIPMRRCNLSCAYCNEYDDNSKPVPLETMRPRLDRLAAASRCCTRISMTSSRTSAAAESSPG